MIYLGNGIYSESGPDTLAHYGVIGMKWGIHKARIHEKNLYRYNRANGMSRADAKAQYRSRMAGVKSYARKNLRTGMKARDIATNSYNKANRTIADYDNLRKAQKSRKIRGAVLGAAALGAAGYGVYRYAKGKKQIKTAQKSFDSAFKARDKRDMAESILNRARSRGNTNLAEKASQYMGKQDANFVSKFKEGSRHVDRALKSKEIAKNLVRTGVSVGAGVGAGMLASRLNEKKALRKKRKD